MRLLPFMEKSGERCNKVLNAGIECAQFESGHFCLSLGSLSFPSSLGLTVFSWSLLRCGFSLTTACSGPPCHRPALTMAGTISLRMRRTSGLSRRLSCFCSVLAAASPNSRIDWLGSSDCQPFIPVYLTAISVLSESCVATVHRASM